jgi:hypothetical protein
MGGATRSTCCTPKCWFDRQPMSRRGVSANVMAPSAKRLRVIGETIRPVSDQLESARFDGREKPRFRGGGCRVQTARAIAGTRWRGATKASFLKTKRLAAQFAPLEARSCTLFDEAAANLQKPEGEKYQKDIEQSISKCVQPCAQDDTDRTKFEFRLHVADGGPRDVWMPHPTAIGNCL